jgi:hypothetical protein
MTEGFGGVIISDDASGGGAEAWTQIGGVNGNWVRAVMRWDISSLAGKGTISAARAKIQFQPVVRAESFGEVPEEFSFRLYRLAPANADWVDAEVSRDNRKADTPWAGSDGAGTPDVDYLTPEVAKVTFTGGENRVAKEELTFEFTDTSFFQDWVTNPQNNAGFLLISEELEIAGGDSGDSQFVQGTMFPDDIPTSDGGRYPTSVQPNINTVAVPEDRPILEIDFSPSVGVAGDYNGNGVVDAADYVYWRDTLEQTVAAGTGADGSGNGTIGPEDYTFWRERFGNTSGSGAGAAVPEPNCLTYGLVTCAIFFATRRSARSRVE